MTNPATVNVAVNLDSLFVEPAEYDGEPVDIRTAMRQAVVEAAATKLVASFGHEDLQDMRTEVRDLRNRLVRERLAAEVDAAFSAPVQRTSRWAEPQGDPVTIRELIRLELEAFLNGTQTNRRHDSYDKTPNNLAQLIGQIANDTMNGALAGSVRDAKAKVDKRVQEILVEAVGAKLAGVKR